MANTTAPSSKVAEPFKTLMADLYVSINGLSETTRIPFATLRRKLHDPESFTVGNLLRIADALGVEPAALIPKSATARRLP